MAWSPTNPPRDTTPGDAPSGATELYETTSIRFVTLEIGKLTAKVDRLITDVHDVSEKVSKTNTKITRFEALVGGGFVVLVVMLTFFWWVMGDHIKAAVDQAFRAAYAAPTSAVAPPTPAPTHSPK